MERIAATGGKVLSHSDTWVEFSGLDCTADDMSYATPLDAMNFLSTVQRELKGADTHPESSSQGLLDYL